MLNKEIGKLCFYLSMNFIHLGDGSCKEAQTAILHFHNLVEKSHKRCIFRHKCAICPPHCVPSTILVYSGTEMLVHHVILSGLCAFPCHSTVHYQTFAWLFLYFSTVSSTFLPQGCLPDRGHRVGTNILFIWFSSVARIPHAFLHKLITDLKCTVVERVCKQYCSCVTRS